ncbi:MAG: hypothetical protein KY475_19570 [Planctomycetes bacterium]|nr:hypothetical protein [Planctomycetota bacterium]
MLVANPLRAAGSVCCLAMVLALAERAAATPPEYDPFEVIVQQPEAPDEGGAVQPDGAQPSQPDQAAPPAARQPPPTPETQRPPQPRSSISGRQAGFLLASAPNMFGDFFGGGPALVTVQGAPILIPQTISDGNPLNLQVISGTGQPGADPDPAVPIMVLSGGVVLTQSIGPGQDASGDQQPDLYPIADPAALAPGGPLGPPLPAPGTVVFNNGVAVFTAGQPLDPANPAQAAADNSVRMADGWALAFSHIFTPNAFTVSLPNGGGAGVRRIKIAEDNSPQPRSRLFWNYNFFNDVFGGVGDVNRYVFGLEYAFFDNRASIEVRAPMASTIASEQTAVFGGAALHDTEFGNMTFTYKQVLIQGDRGLLSAGLGVALPTGDDARLALPGGPTILAIDNESLHLLPFVAILSNAGERLFWQAFLQLDVDTNGNTVRADVTGADVAPIGVFHDATLMFLDVGVGYRVYQNPNGAITQISPVAELHYSTTLEDIDTVAGGGVTVQGVTDRFDVVNLTMGVDVATQGQVNIRPAMAIPLTGGNDEHFDYEAMVQVNVGY